MRADDRDPERKAHDLIMVQAWRENLLRLMVDAELAFRLIENGYEFADADEWADVLEGRGERIRRRCDAVLAHVAHARNLVTMDAELQRLSPRPSSES